MLFFLVIHFIVTIISNLKNPKQIIVMIRLKDFITFFTVIVKENV